MIWKICICLDYDIFKCWVSSMDKETHRSAQLGVSHVIWLVHKEKKTTWTVPRITVGDKHNVKQKRKWEEFLQGRQTELKHGIKIVHVQSRNSV